MTNKLTIIIDLDSCDEDALDEVFNALDNNSIAYETDGDTPDL